MTRVARRQAPRRPPPARAPSDRPCDRESAGFSRPSRHTHISVRDRADKRRRHRAVRDRPRKSRCSRASICALGETEDANASRIAFRHEEIAVRREAQDAGSGEARREGLDRETVQRLRRWRLRDVATTCGALRLWLAGERTSADPAARSVARGPASSAAPIAEGRDARPARRGRRLRPRPPQESPRDPPRQSSASLNAETSSASSLSPRIQEFHRTIFLRPFK